MPESGQPSVEVNSPLSLSPQNTAVLATHEQVREARSYHDTLTEVLLTHSKSQKVNQG